MSKSTKKTVVHKEPEVNMIEAIEALAEEKHIDKEIIFNAIRDGIKKVYEKRFDPDAELTIEFDRHTGEIKIFKHIKVVKKVEDELLEIGLSEAKAKYGDDVTIDDIVFEPIDSKEFSRLAVILGSQIIKQNIREAEKDSILKEFAPRKGEIMYGEVSAVEENYILIAVERTYAFLPKTNCIPGDDFNIGDRICFLAEDIIKSKNAGQIKATRVSNEFLIKLLEIEVTELLEGVVTVKAAARNPGVRSKIAVYSSNPNIDPIGACVGPKGTRINIVSEKLNGEKIDVCLWDEDETQFIINALAPVKVISIETDVQEAGEYYTIGDDGEEIEHKKYRKEANVVVPNEQLSLAIGKKGSAAKLVAKLTHWKLNIISEEQANETGVELKWNGNINQEEVGSLQTKLQDKVRVKDQNYRAKLQKEAELEAQQKRLVEELLAEASTQIITSEDDEPIEIFEDETETVIDDLENAPELENIDEALNYLEEKALEDEGADADFYKDINYDDYDEYYDK